MQLWNWLKDYKCYYIVSIAPRESSIVFSFEPIAISIPLKRKRQRGAKKKTTPALVRQSIEILTGEIDSSSLDDKDKLATSIIQIM